MRARAFSTCTISAIFVAVIRRVHRFFKYLANPLLSELFFLEKLNLWTSLCRWNSVFLSFISSKVSTESFKLAEIETILIQMYELLFLQTFNAPQTIMWLFKWRKLISRKKCVCVNLRLLNYGTEKKKWAHRSLNQSKAKLMMKS